MSNFLININKSKIDSLKNFFIKIIDNKCYDSKQANNNPKTKVIISTFYLLIFKYFLLKRQRSVSDINTAASNVVTTSNLRIIGLKNFGNTCFINSILQALFHIKKYANWINSVYALINLKNIVHLHWLY
jgi:ubiquitin C-terminal hydrolase